MASFGKFRFLTLIKPVLHILPEVAPPDRKIPFKVRAAERSADLGTGRLCQRAQRRLSEKLAVRAFLRRRRLGMYDCMSGFGCSSRSRRGVGDGCGLPASTLR
jgi:hypothetical protein